MYIFALAQEQKEEQRERKRLYSRRKPRPSSGVERSEPGVSARQLDSSVPLMLSSSWWVKGDELRSGELASKPNSKLYRLLLHPARISGCAKDKSEKI